MKYSRILVLLSVFALFGYIQTVPTSSSPSTLNDWVGQQHKFSVDQISKNIHPAGTAPGIVVASPSKREPDYWYHWVRDAALTMDVINDQYEHEYGDLKYYEQIMNDFVALSRRNQQTQTRSKGLGEPKFNVDGSAFNDEWGRPQNDGPALRALTIMRFGELYHKKTGSRKYIDSVYTPQLPPNSVVKADLEFVSHNWMEVNFDLWEEILAHNFYTMMVQRRSLLEGARFAKKWFNDTGAANWYEKVANDMGTFMDKYWDGSKNYILSHVDIVKERSKSKPSNLDCAVALAALHSKASVTDGFYGPDSDRVLRTVTALKDVFSKIYTLNQKTSQLPPGIGRYPDDEYNGINNSRNGGNPWFICTAAFSELYFQVISRSINNGAIKITPLSAPFFTSLANGTVQTAPGEYKLGSKEFTAVVTALKAEADGYLERVRTHANKDGHLSEQFNRDTGLMQGAPDLTWSYGAFVTASDARSAAEKLMAKL
ncbi:Six-hairpin glycosidase-like protein [Paraphysoderma sedebokerense]|nr:Six-hairpin glycosidase-like protein [Paraphysoderma sedebokerense]